jgi:hypothetical protein
VTDVSVVIVAVRAEATKWGDLATDVEPIATAAKHLTLEPTSFFIGDFSAGVYASAYAEFQASMAEVLAGAMVEFDQIGTALRKIADEYDRADAFVALNLNEIWTR